MMRDSGPTTPGRWHAACARFLRGLTLRVAARPILVLTAALLLIGASIGIAACGLEFRPSRDDLLHRDSPCQLRWRNYLAEFGTDDDYVFILRGGSLGERTAAADDLVATLLAHPEQFDRVFHQLDLSALRSRMLQLLELKQLRAILDMVRALEPLLASEAARGWQHVTAETVARSRGLFPALPTEFLTGTGPTHLLTPGGGMVLVLARPRPSDDSLNAAQAITCLARSLVDEVRRRHPEVEFGLTGLPVLEADEMAATAEDTQRANLLAVGGIAALYWFVYRGLRRPMLTLATLAAGTALALGWATLTVGHLNVLSAAFAVMLIGIGDYGVLWLAHYDAASSHAAPREALGQAAEQAGPGILTAACTSALAFFTCSIAEFEAVAELGWIAGWGILFCTVACFVLMPALIVLTEPGRHGNEAVGRGENQSVAIDHEQCAGRERNEAVGRAGIEGDGAGPHASGMKSEDAGSNNSTPATGTLKPHSSGVKGKAAGPDRFGVEGDWLPGLARRPRCVLLAAAVMGLISLAGLPRLRYDANLLHLQSSTFDSVRWEHALIAEAPGATWDALSIARCAAGARALRRRYEALPEVGVVMEAGSLVGDDLEAKRPILAELGERLGRLPAELPASVVGPGVPREDAAARHNLLAALQALRAAADPRPILPADLPPTFRERYISPRGQFLVRVHPRASLWDVASLEQFTRAVQAVDPEATGKSFRTVEGLRQMRAGFIQATGLALLVILVVLILDLRWLRLVLLGLIPLGLGLTATLGIMGWTGVSLNPANLVALPLILGVGVDHGVHVLHDFRHQLWRRYRLSRAVGRGITVTGGTTILCFGTLMIGRHEGMASLGLMLGLGVAACMAASLVVLPAILRVAGQPFVSPSRWPLPVSLRRLSLSFIQSRLRFPFPLRRGPLI